MPVSNVDVVDAIAINPETGVVVLSMFEERDWADVDSSLGDLERKVNSYLGYVFQGQMSEVPEYRGKRIAFEILFQFVPPEKVVAVLRKLEAHLSSQDVGFNAFVTIGPTGRLRI